MKKPALNSIKITQRKLKENEVGELMKDVKTYPDLIYISKSRWNNFTNNYIIEENNTFTGICAVYDFGKWIKLGPFAILKKHHGKGFGSLLMKKIVEDYKKEELFVASSNKTLHHIMKKLGFIECTSFFSLPMRYRIFLIKQFFENLCFQMIIEYFRKMYFYKRGKVKFFVKPSV